MYLPAAFRETRIEVMHGLMRSNPLATMGTACDNGLNAAPEPFLSYPFQGE